MRGQDFMELRAFELVARRLSFSRAADEIGMSRATLSQIVKTLEAKIGVQLLQRTTRSVALTEAGHELLDRLSPVLNELVNAVGNIQRFRDSPSGTVRISADNLSADLHLKRLVPAFAERYPDVVLEIVIEEGHHGLLSRAVDGAVRSEDQHDVDAERLKLGNSQRQLLVASSKYIEARGAPEKLSDLNAHRCIGIRSGKEGSAYRWQVHVDETVEKVDVDIGAPLIVNDHRFALDAAISGFGVAMLPKKIVQSYIDLGDLQIILPSFFGVIPPYYLFYSKKNFSTLAFKSLLKFIAHESPHSNDPESAFEELVLADKLFELQDERP